MSETGTGGACVDGKALVGPRSVAVSPDGKNFYFPASGSRAVAVFARHGTTGALAQLAGTDGCVSETGTGGVCADGTALDGARSAALSPDGTSVYVTSYFSDAVAVFSRDPTTGALTQLGTNGCVSETGTGGMCADGTSLDGARTVAISPDGKHVYVASEISGAISVFSRDQATGAITQLGATAGCVSQTGGACAGGRALGGAGGVTLSPDGSSLYVASLSSDSIAVFSRDGQPGRSPSSRGRPGA